MTALTRVSMDPFICREFYHAHVKGMSVPEEQHANQNERRGNDIPDKVHPMDALTMTKARVLILDIKTIPALSHLTNQPRHKFLNLLLEITRLFTLKGVPLIGLKNVKSRKSKISLSNTQTTNKRSGI